MPAEVAAKLSFGNLESTLQKTRGKNTPLLPTNAIHYSDLLKSEEWRGRYGTCLNGTLFFRENIIVADKSNLIFISENLKNLLATSQELHIDGTFKTVPSVRGLKQLLVVMAIAHDHVSRLYIS